MGIWWVATTPFYSRKRACIHTVDRTLQSRLLFSAVFGLCRLACLPFHIGRSVGATVLQCARMVDDIAAARPASGPGGRARMRGAKGALGLRTALDATA